jgi:hypothetical protein
MVDARARTYKHTHTLVAKCLLGNINHVEKECGKLIFSLSKSAKITWGLKHEALKTIYTGGILPLLLYGAPVWTNVMNKCCYKPN